MKSEALKKHHFWILAGVATFFGLLTALFIWTGAGSEISAKMELIEKNKKDASSTNGLGTQALGDYEKQKIKLTEQKELLWKANYDRQKSLFAWPNSLQLQALAKKHTKFGEPLANTDALDEIKRKDVYEQAYEDAAKDIRPTEFNNRDWRTVLRHVSDWTIKRPTSNQVWLALEDLWVQRSLLEPVKKVNEGAARFDLVKGPNGEDPPALNRTFLSRVWKLELSIPTEGSNANKVIEARLTNRTDRLQLYGMNNVLRFKVWLDDEYRTPWILYRLEGDFVKAGETVEVKLSYPAEVPGSERAEAKKAGKLTEVRLDARRLHGIPPGIEIRKIAKVEQILDEQTVPVRRIAAMELGKKDARHSIAALKTPVGPQWEVPAAATTGVAPGGMTDPGGAGGSPDGGGGFMGGRLPGSPDGGMGGGGTGRGKTGTPVQVCDGNVRRYLETTQQVRRMPVAVLLVVDQLFMQDALVAYANSSLRFQITQYHWKRFRGSLGSLQSTGNDDEGGGGTGGYGGYGGSEGYSGPPGGAGASAPGLPSGPGGPGSDETGSADGGATGGYPSGRGFRGGFGGFGTGESSGSTLSEGQRTSGLVELTIYGVVTLYERYDEKPADGATPAATTPTTTEPQPAPMGTTPMGTTPAPMGTTPMGTTPMTPLGGTPAPMTPMTPAPAPPMTPAPMGGTPPAQPPKM